MNHTLRRQVTSLRVRALICCGLALATVDGTHAAVMVRSADGSQGRKVDVPTIQPVVLPDCKDVLSVDWVDTKNARLAVGGLNYSVRGALPDITLADGTRVKDIGYLKKGTQVRIEVANVGGVSRLTDVRVVAAAADPSGATGQGTQATVLPDAANGPAPAPRPGTAGRGPSTGKSQ